jgi:DNA-binding SARP family transcriptional activator
MAVCHLYLMGGFELRDRGEVVDLPLASQRVLAFVALQRRQVPRSVAAGTLWPESTEARAGANLRSALWRLRRPGVEIVRATPTHLVLDAAVDVDVHRCAEVALGLLDGGREPDPAFAGDLHRFQAELLPEVWDAWLIVERERVRQLHLHALEHLTEWYMGRGRHAEAVLAGMAAVDMDPLRESAYRVLISAHLAEGNRVEAIRRYRAYERLLDEELAIDPSPELGRLVGAHATVMPR